MRIPKPFLRRQTGTYYLQIGKRQINLGKDKAAADIEYHRLMAERGEPTPRITAHAVIDRFLGWAEANREPGTVAFYRRHLDEFKQAISPRLKAAELKRDHVTRWVDDRYRGLSDNYRHNAIRSVQRAFKWATDQDLIPPSKVASIQKPEQTPRETIVTAEQWQAIRAEVTDREFLDLLEILKETGCRPQEARIVEARHVDRERRQWILERQNSKGKKVRRVVRLNDAAWAITQRLLMKWPEGALFRTTEGQPWRKESINSRFYRLRQKLGFRVFAYSFRHTWATNAIKAGVDITSIAILLGHRDASMLLKVYSHLIQDESHLDAKLKLATAG
ncbi:MAG TPA: tyrosine-type recombinase/integrase [Pirellulales bacterium]|nr:tyrosine-type recombinase/integrase [Pirellulales bacterium]